MSESTGSMGPFLEGYREQLKRNQFQKRSYLPEVADALALFRERDVRSLTVLQMAAELMITTSEAKKVADELERRRLAIVKRSPDVGYLVELTKLGRQLTKE